MLVITKTNDDYGYYTIDGLSVEKWRENASELPPEIVIAIDDDHPLRPIFNGIGRFEPVIKGKKLIDVIEFPPLAVEKSPQEEAKILADNIAKSNEIILQYLEPILPKLFELVDEPIPDELSRNLNARNDLRKDIETILFRNKDVIVG